MMTRRFALALLGGTALAGCAGGSSSFAAAATDVATIAQAFGKIVPQLSSLVPAATIATLTTYVNDLTAAASALASAGTASAGQTIVAQIENYVNNFISVAATFPLPPPIPTYLAAASILLPVLEAAVGLVTGPAYAPAARRMAALNPGMAPENARLLLRSAAVAH